MARGRIVNKKITVDERVNNLPGDGPLFFTWLITHLDRNGRYSANTSVLKGNIFPLRRASEKQINQWLSLMESSKNGDNKPLIFRYEVAGKRVLEMPGFNGEQIGLPWAKESDEYPPPPPDCCWKICGKNPEDCRNNSGKNPEDFRIKSGVREEKRREENLIKENNPPKVPLVQSKGGRRNRGNGNNEDISPREYLEKYGKGIDFEESDMDSEELVHGQS